MSFQVPEEYVEEKKPLDKMFSFWLKGRTLRRFATVCGMNRVEKASVLRFLVALFLDDDDLQERIVRGVSNG